MTFDAGAVGALVARTPIALARSGFGLGALIAAGVLLALGSFATPTCLFLCHAHLLISIQDDIDDAEIADIFNFNAFFC